MKKISSIAVSIDKQGEDVDVEARDLKYTFWVAVKDVILQAIYRRGRGIGLPPHVFCIVLLIPTLIFHSQRVCSRESDPGKTRTALG